MLFPFNDQIYKEDKRISAITFFCAKYGSILTQLFNMIYCRFPFFHGCKCSADSPLGHDANYVDYNNVFLNSDNPIYECYTTNTDDQRVCYAYNYAIASAWTYDQSMKKDWLKDKTIYVSMNGNDSYELCGAYTTFPCLTVKKAFEMCEVQISLAITLMDGNHISETTTIEIGSKKISVIGMGKEKNVIGTGAVLLLFSALHCSFLSVCDVYDGGIVPSLNSPSSSLDASNTSFVRCYRSQNVAVNGSEDNPSKPARQQIADNEANSFTWCVWNGTKTTGTSGSYSDGVSSGGAINMISGCEFQKCKANSVGGGLYLENFNVSGSSCIGTESGKGESACVFGCSFTSCSLTYSSGGGMYCYNVPSAFKMRSLQFISCSAVSYGGGLCFNPNQQIAPSNNIYCYFFFFHDCSCNASTPYGHDVYFQDNNNLFSSYNPFYESYTTNGDNRRVCYNGNSLQHTEKKGWLKEGMKDRYVGVGGSDTSNLCGMSESAPCKTVGHAVESSMAQLSSTITVLGGRHVSEGATINVGEKKISVLGRGKAASVIGTNSLSSISTTLFSVTSGQLESK
ncbi:uncharacterized protein MONOS_4588 [Monocercomonoides exilis]|uniref:uncharacterized protein n=1 Tax=Monocercomonoides exilis TaxID=2049356 RepID=UPI00355A5CF3|nr:hypothetical protein MONOS_4588 [Monocercomonoides exilis]|eukprot:MONOS_4588.1-p1 / transcript=MONOS_4588.1 / gene=MONOS_4588 / organism=Monocercomonoides_exilis_PA203 / gene_product=unspecified product / transcript_product=unspecified product / location=Mono_scaffold00123:100355-103422(-) / protein_length=568 / sequence_SO=supercontig / SO=protein_coding / is_pseudo=false